MLNRATALWGGAVNQKGSRTGIQVRAGGVHVRGVNRTGPILGSMAAGVVKSGQPVGAAPA